MARRTRSIRKSKVIINNANIYLIDYIWHSAMCNDIIELCNETTKLQCALSVSSRDSNRNVTEVKCIGEDDSYKILGSISRSPFDADVAFTTDNDIGKKLYDAFDTMEPLLFVIEYLIDTGNFYEIISVKVSKRTQVINADDVVKYTFTLEPFGINSECRGSFIYYSFDPNGGYCTDENLNNFVVNSANSGFI